MQTRLAAAKSKAEAVVGQEDLSERGKAREIEKLYAKARAGKGVKKSKPTRVQKRHAKGPPLDGRMRADKRQVGVYCPLLRVSVSVHFSPMRYCHATSVIAFHCCQHTPRLVTDCP